MNTNIKNSWRPKTIGELKEMLSKIDDSQNDKVIVLQEIKNGAMHDYEIIGQAIHIDLIGDIDENGNNINKEYHSLRIRYIVTH